VSYPRSSSGVTGKESLASDADASYTEHSTIQPSLARIALLPSATDHDPMGCDRSRSVNVDGREYPVQRNRLRHMVGGRAASAFLRYRRR
jgi:hypothetical protein